MARNDKRIDQLKPSANALKATDLFAMYSDNRTEQQPLSNVIAYLQSTINASYFTGGTINGETIFTDVISACTSTVYINTLSPCGGAGSTMTFNGSIDISGSILSGGTNIDSLFGAGGVWELGSSGTESIRAINGTNVDATANYAVAQGRDSIASGITAHAEGDGTVAGGNYSHAEGQYSKAYGQGSHAEGDSTLAIGADSHAEGNQSRAVGQTSHAEGNASEANGSTSHAEGWVCIANGDSSHAEGWITRAEGERSHSQGYLTVALGDKSHAGGSESTSSGNTSFVHSTNSLVIGNRSAILGGQNITGNTDDTVYVPHLEIRGQANTPVYDSGSGTTFTLDFNNSNIQTITVTGNTTMNNPSNVKDGGVYTVIIKQGVTTGTINSWDTNFKFEGGTTPTLTTNSYAVDIITFISDNAGNLYGLTAFDFQ